MLLHPPPALEDCPFLYTSFPEPSAKEGIKGSRDPGRKIFPVTQAKLKLVRLSDSQTQLSLYSQTGDAKKLKQLEEKNRKLKHVVAELMLDNRVLKDVISKNW